MTVVENPRVPPGVGEWQLGPEPLVEIGVLNGEAPYQLFRVADAARLGDGRIVVINGGTNELRVYGADGGHLATWGGEGEGPGEFLLMQSLVRWPGDSLAVWDSDGSLARLVRLAEPLRPLSAAAWEAELQRRIAEVPEQARAGIRALWDRVPRPDTLPAISTVVHDAADHIWIRGFVFAATDTSARWIVLDPSGQAVASLDLPAGMEVYDIGTDYLVGVVRDDLDVERVQVWPLRRGS